MTATRVALALGALALGGCYHVGFQPEPGLTAIAVPVFDNATLRRELEHALTRYVRQEVLETTPLQLAPEVGAARVLRGRITAVEEGVLIAGPQEQVEHAGLTVTVRFGVHDETGALVVGEDTDADGVPDAELTRTGYAEYTPLRGQDREAAADEALRDLAQQIVAELQAREDDRWEPNDGPAQAVPLTPGRQVALRQRNPDWFKVTLPPGQVLVATLYHGVDGVRLEARAPGGAPLPEAVSTDEGGGTTRLEGRLVTVPATAAAREVLLVVTGDDTGREYRLRVRVTAPRPE